MMLRAVSGRTFKAAPGSSGWRDRGVAVRPWSGVKSNAVPRSRMENTITDTTTLAVRWLDDRSELRHSLGPDTLMKVVHFVRHGEGTHNVAKAYRCAPPPPCRKTPSRTALGLGLPLALRLWLLAL